MPKVLIVDNNDEDRLLVRRCLSNRGLAIIEAASGEQALELIVTSAPDLVLLDARIPGLDGFEAARRIKETAKDQFLPVIVLAGLDDRDSRVRALRLGADEFLSKPVDRQELTVRVRNLLALREKEATLQRRNLHLLELMRFRDEMSALLVHDLRTPTSIIQLSLDYLRSTIPPDNRHAIQAMSDARSATDRIARIVANLLDVVRLESDRLVLHRAPTRLAPLLSLVAERGMALARQRQVDVQVEADPAVQVHADVDILTRVIENVVENSLRHVPRGGRILMRTEALGESAIVLVGNDGPPVPLEMREAIFEKFTRGDEYGTRPNLGLGLYFCKLAMAAHGGTISVGDCPLPAVFRLELPVSLVIPAAQGVAEAVH